MLRTEQSFLATAPIHLHSGRVTRDFLSSVLSRTAVTPSTGLYRRLRNLRPNFVLVIRFIINDLSVSRPQDDSGWKGAWERRWAVVWTEYCRRCDQVRRYSHPFRVYADVSLVQCFPDTSLGISLAVEGQIFQTDMYSA